MKWASATWQRRHGGHLFPILFLFLLRSTAAQTFNSTPPPPPNFNSDPFKPQFNPGMAAIVIALISAFFVMAFFSIYIRNRRDRLENQRLPIVGAARPGGGGAARGLDPAVVESFPKFAYSEVKQHKIGKGALECAVCLSEFEDDDNLRLLPKCDHVFHPDCIDSWFAAHTTCPVCRMNFAAEAGGAAVAEPPPEVAIAVNEGEERPEAEEELAPLPPGRQRRRIPRSHSTGHSVLLSEDRERYTLRLPEMIRRDVVAGRFKRSASCYAGGEGRAAKGRSVGEMSGGGRSSFKVRTWDRWASFKRSFSVKGPRGEEAGTSGGGAAAAVGRSFSKTKEGRNPEDGSVNVSVPGGADR